jgi:membrane protein
MLDFLRRRVPWLGTPIDVHERVTALGGGPLAASVTLAMFLSLFPLLLVGIAALGFVASGNVDFASEVIENLGLEGEAAERVLEAIDTAEDSRRAASVVGFAGLVWAGLGVVGALEAALNVTWQTTGRGITSKLVGVGWLLGAGVLFVASAALGPVLNWLPGPAIVATVLGGVLLDTALFLWMFRTLTNVSVHWRTHLPGAIAGGIGFEVLKLVGGIFVPHAVASSSALYGSLGIVFAMLAWLALLARLTVYCSAFNVVRYEQHHGTVTVELEVPNIEGEVPIEATRGGAVAEAVSEDEAQSATAAGQDEAARDTAGEATTAG